MRTLGLGILTSIQYVLSCCQTRVNIPEARQPMSIPVVRNPKMAFAGADIPKYWLYSKALPTHLANGLNLLFPAGERFFVRSVLAYAGDIIDLDLKARIKAFAAQEVQ